MHGHHAVSGLLSAAVALLVLASPLRAQADFAGIDSMIEDQLRQGGVPGGALVIVHGDQVVHTRGFGVADGSGRKVTPETPFYLGSTTKSFTALAILDLVDEGRVDLDAPVQRYLPWFTLADSAFSRGITVRQSDDALGRDSGPGRRVLAGRPGYERRSGGAPRAGGSRA